MLVAGLLPFGAVFIELFFIFTAIWQNQFYYLFGFLFLVFVILVISCAQISIVMMYFQLCAEVRNLYFISFSSLLKSYLLVCCVLVTELPLVVEVTNGIRWLSGTHVPLRYFLFHVETADHRSGADFTLLRLHRSYGADLLAADVHHWILFIVFLH